MKKENRHPRTSAGDSELPWHHQSDIPVRRLLLRAALRLLKYGPLSDELLGLCIELLAPKRRVECVRFLDTSGLSDSSSLYQAAADPNPTYLSSQIPLELSHPRNRRIARSFFRFLQGKLSHEFVTDRRKNGSSLRLMQPGTKLYTLVRVFGLRPVELRLVALLYCVECSPAFKAILDTDRPHVSLTLLARAGGLTRDEVCTAVDRDSRLIANEIVEYSGPAFGRTRLAQQVELSEPVLRFLDGPDGVTLVPVRRSQSASVPLSVDDFPGKSTEARMILALLRSDRPISILVYGAPGTGKTEFVRTLCAAVARDPVFVPAALDDERDVRRSRRFLLRVTARTSDPHKQLVIVDDAEDLLQTNASFDFLGISSGDTGGRKAVMNQFLDESDRKIIWICNDVRGIDSAVRRRFSYSVEFRRLTSTARRSIWKTVLAQAGLAGAISQPEIEQFVRQFEVNAAGIAEAVRTAASVVSAHPDVHFRDCAANLLTKHEHLLHGTVKKVSPADRAFDLGFIQTDISIEAISQALSGVCRAKESGAVAAPLGAAILFSGPPGSGKSETARYLASLAGSEIVAKRGSDLLSMWVGGTERNIADAFNEAEEDNALLLIDEADSFIFSREYAGRSWETSMINEFLQQIENFKGTLICTTNSLPSLDLAGLRRFQWKVRFSSLPQTKRIAMMSSLFPEFVPDPASLSTLASIPELYPGDFAIVRRRFAVSPVDISTEPSASTIVHMLEEEAAYRTDRRTVVGFK